MNGLKAFENLEGSEIAIIGMAGRFPGAQNLDKFWANLRDGEESITFFSDEELLASGVKPSELNNPSYVKARPKLEDIELFDASFFGFSPREASAMDPQHRLFLECVWEAIENAGYDVERCKSAISVYAGASMSSYLMNNLFTNRKAMALAGEFQISIFNNLGSLATSVAYKLNLKGPCYSIQTFCSTSLVAVHMACQSLLNFECDMAIAGGVSIFVPQNTGYFYQEGLIVSPDGHCRPFDAKARGTVFGNGLGAVVLKRLEDALTDGDHIEAVILGSATNNDGSLKVSYTAPSVSGQAEVIVEALGDAGVDPEMITYVETHGTGTALGDPTEVTALTRAFRSKTQKKCFCALGSVKSNIGHLDVAAGVASLIKTVLSLKHQTIPPSLHYETPNPEIDFANSPFYVNSRLSEWKSDGSPRCAGVSSFGFGGTNAHIIVQEAPIIEPSSASRPYQLLVLSSKTSSALDKMTSNLVEHLKQHPNINLADVAYTLQVGRKAFNHRQMIICKDVKDAVSMLETADQKPTQTVYLEQRNPPVAFMFSGQGSQYVNMGLQLYRSESKFKEEIDLCTKILEPHLSLNLRDILYPEEHKVEEAELKLNQTYITQPALFTIEYSLAKLWISWGIQPEALVGHSIGEYVAACLSGVFSLKDALSLVATRGRLFQELPEGSMLAVFLSEKEIKSFLGENLSLAAINGPSICSVSGDKNAIEALENDLSKKKVNYTRLHTSHAFHSQMVEPILDKFAEHVRQVRLHQPKIPFASNVTGTWITSDEATSPSYWARHLRQTVRFSDCVKELLKEQNRVFLEVGPGHTLSTLTRQHLNRSNEKIVLSSIRHPKEQKSDITYILDTLGRLWLAGIQIDWSGFYAEETRHRVPLPAYPFERKRHWVESCESVEQEALFSSNEDVKTSIFNLLQEGDTRKTINRLEKTGKFSQDEMRLLPKLLKKLVEEEQEQQIQGNITKLLYEVQWPPKLRFGLPNYMISPKEIHTRLIPKLASLMAHPDMKIYKELLIQLEALSVAYILNAFREMKWEFRLKKRFSSTFLEQQLGVVRQHKRLLNRILEILTEEGILRRTSSKWEVIKVPKNEDPQKNWSKLIAKYPGAVAELTLLERCGANLAQVLRGECEPLELLFAKGDLKEATKLYQDSPVAKEMNTLMKEATLMAIERLSQGEGVRILEIGAGTGGTTSQILPHLPNDQIEYVFTDISITFTRNAQEKFSDYSFVRYKILNIEKDIKSQGFDFQQFDLIIATNVLHATKNLRQTLRHVHQLLAPGGMLLLMENTAPQRWVDLIFGLLEGWWKFDDLDLRPSYPLLSGSQWIKLLEENGFKEAVIIDPSHEREGGLLHQAVIVAQADEMRTEEVISEAGKWLIFSDVKGIGKQLATILEAKGEICILAFKDKKFEQSSEYRFKIDPKSQGDFHRLLDMIEINRLPLRGIVHLWSLDDVVKEALDFKNIKLFLEIGCISTLHLVNALIRKGLSQFPRVFLVTRGAQPVGKEPDVRGLIQSTLWGIGESISQKNPEMKCVRVDLDPVAREDDAQALFKEIWSVKHEYQVAFRDKIRQVARLVQSPMSKDAVLENKLHIKNDSTYMIVGGLGKVSLLAARWMVERGARHLVVMVKNGISNDMSNELRRLEQENVQVILTHADLSNEENIIHLHKQIKEILPPLRGIILSDLMTCNGDFKNQNQKLSARDIAFQLLGVWNLHMLTIDMPLDFFLLFSYATWIPETFNNENNMVANAFKNSLSYYRRKQNLAGLAINWGFLQEIGEDVTNPFKKNMNEKGIMPIPQQLGFEILDILLQEYLIRVEVIDINWPAFMQQCITCGEFAFFSEIPKSEEEKDKIEQKEAKKIELFNEPVDTDISSEKEAELLLVNIWQEVLGIEKIGIHDNFFDLGGNSLIAVTLFSEIETKFGKKLPLATLYKAPSIKQMAALLCEKKWKSPWISLVEINADGSKPPLFLMHGAGGNILFYRDLARHLGPDQPVYGLQSQGLDGEKKFHERIEDMAEHYVKEIQTLQPKGPYFLGGYCLGGTIALEVAQQLHEQDQEVALLALLETYNWAKIKDISLLDNLYFYIQKVEFHLRNYLLLNFKEKWTFIQEKMIVAKGRSKVLYGIILARLGQRFRERNGQYLTLSKLWKHNDQASFNYVPKVYEGRITQFNTIKQYALLDDPELGWEKLATGGVETHQLPVYPAGMLVEPFVVLLAEKLNRCIDMALKKMS